MRKILKLTITFCLALLCLSFAGCAKDATKVISIETDTPEVFLNKRGLGYEGGTVYLTVKANSYWTLNYDDDAEWVVPSRKAGTGTQEIKLTVKENLDEAPRSVVLYFDTIEGVKLEVTVRQAGAGEKLVYFEDSFGENPESVPAEDYDRSGKTGFGSDMVAYSGSAVVRPVDVPSPAESGSGGNAVCFDEDGQTLVLGPVSIFYDTYFCMSFMVRNASGKVLADALRMEVSTDGYDWFEYKYEPAAEAAGWNQSFTRFWTVDVNRMYIRLTGKAGYMIDDLKIVEGDMEDKGKEMIFADSDDDNNPVGFQYWMDAFDWLTTPDFAEYCSDLVTTGEDRNIRFDNIINYPEQMYQAFLTAGWTEPTLGSGSCTYMHLGYIRIGKSKTATAVAAPLLPIREGRRVNLELSFDAHMRGTDLDGIKIEVTGGATVESATKTEIELPLNLWNVWPADPYVVNIYNATSETQIIFKNNFTTASLAALNLSNRFVLDNVKVKKIAKKTEIKENWETQLQAPVLDATNVSGGASAISAQWVAPDHAFRFKYELTDDKGATVASGEIDKPNVSVSGLKPNLTFMLRVKALPHAESLRYTESEWSETVSVVTVDKDPHDVGYVFFEDNFDWIDERFAVSEGFIGGWVNQECKSINTATYSQEAVNEWLSRGYGYATSKCRVYIQHGRLSIGRTVSASKNVGDHAGYFDLPVAALSDIADDAAINVKFEIDAAVTTSLNDTRLLTIECTNGESYDLELQVPSGELRTWESMPPVIFHNVSKDMRIRVGTMKKQSEVVPNRICIDNIKITKASAEE